MQKNVAAQKWIIFAYNKITGDPETGDAANITGNLRLDGGAANAIDDVNPTELEDGYYIFDITQAESNADNIVIAPASSTANILVIGVPGAVWTRPPNFEALGIAADGDLSGNIDGNVGGSVASVTGAVGSVAGAVGSVTGSVGSVVAEVSADMVKISGDGPAADNLESQYDTTGLAGGTFPATQDQLSGVANVGAAINTPADSYVLTTGTQSSGTEADTQALDGTNHEHTDVAGAMDLYYEFVIGSGVPTTVIVTGYLNGNNDDLEVYGYDWVASAWVQIGELNGKAASSNEVNSYNLFVNMVGSGANEGLVRIRFTDGAFTLTTATLAIDQIFVSFSRGVEGYDNGAVWIDTTLSNTNTVVGVDGTSRNPVSTMGAVNTLLASTNLHRVEVAPGSTITLAASQDNQVFHGENWTLALGGQSVSATHIIGSTVTGICTGASKPTFEKCHIGAVTMPPCHLEGCTLEGTVTVGSAGTFSFARCQSGVPGSSTPVLDFGALLNSSEVGFRGFSGGIEIQNMGEGTGTYLLTLEGDGQLVINANCSATSSVELRGNFKVTDNAGGAVVVTTDDDTTDINAILVDTNEMQGKLPANNIMGSSVTTDKDDEIDAIKAKTDNLPADPASETNVNANETKIDTLLTRLSAVRAGYLDELGPTNIPADIDTLLTRVTGAVALASVCTEARLAELDPANLPADVDTLLTRITGLIATKAEMDTAHGLLATEAKQDIIDTNVDAILIDTALMDKWLKNRIAFSGASMILYDDDGTTPLLTWTLSQGTLTVSGPYDRTAAA